MTPARGGIVFGAALAAALAVAVVAMPPVHARPSSPGADSVAALERRVDAATARAQRIADALTAAEARDVGLRVALDRLAAQRRLEAARLGRQAHDLYEAIATDPISAYFADVRSPGEELLDAAAGGTSTDADTEYGEATAAAARIGQLEAQARRLRASLETRAAAAYAALDRARAALGAAEQAAAQAAFDATLARALAARQAWLDSVSASVTLAVAVDPGPRGRAALSAQQPVLAALRAAGPGYPAGYAPTGQVIVGQASWYGPGFAGNPTASGAPYDPEQLTCAMLAVPLGTVVRVTDLANGRSVDLLVSDRGPYADGRVLDASHAGAQALGYGGVAQVRIEVLAPAG